MKVGRKSSRGKQDRGVPPKEYVSYLLLPLLWLRFSMVHAREPPGALTPALFGIPPPLERGSEGELDSGAMENATRRSLQATRLGVA